MWLVMLGWKLNHVSEKGPEINNSWWFLPIDAFQYVFFFDIFQNHFAWKKKLIIWVWVRQGKVSSSVLIEY